MSEDEIRSKAREIVRQCGWVPGNSVGLHSAIELMVRLGLAITKEPSEDDCNYPDCGCCRDASCDRAAASAAFDKDAA